MKVTVNQHTCIGAGNCAQVAPAVFGQREEDGIVVLLEAHPASPLEPDVLRAVKICPSKAISVDES